MATERLNRKSWAQAMKDHRTHRTAHTKYSDQVTRAPKQKFSEQIEKRRKSRPKRLSSMEWRARVKLSKNAPGGGRHRALIKPSKIRRGRQPGGQLRSTIPRNRREITEAERKAIPKTGGKVRKVGINASNWAYDHRKSTAKRRSKALNTKKADGKKGINAGSWHYDHRKAARVRALRTAPGKPMTHVSAEKKRTQQAAIAKHGPKQPQQPRPPRANPPKVAKAPVRSR